MLELCINTDTECASLRIGTIVVAADTRRGVVGLGRVTSVVRVYHKDVLKARM